MRAKPKANAQPARSGQRQSRPPLEETKRANRALMSKHKSRANFAQIWRLSRAQNDERETFCQNEEREYGRIRPYSLKHATNKMSQFGSVSGPHEKEVIARRANDQAHPPPEAERGGTTSEAVGGRVPRLVVPLSLAYTFGLVVMEIRTA